MERGGVDGGECEDYVRKAGGIDVEGSEAVTVSF